MRRKGNRMFWKIDSEDQSRTFVTLKFAGYLIAALFMLLACSDDEETIDYANGYPNKLAGNWVVFQFHGDSINDPISGPYDLVTALDPNRKKSLILDNLYNSNLRVRAEIQGDTGIYAINTPQLDLLNDNTYGIQSVSIDGYVNENYILANFIYSLAMASFENPAFEVEDIDEIIFFRAGLYDAYYSLVDTIMVMGYRRTGFEEVEN